MSSCQEIRALIYSYLDQELESDQHVRVREHLAACPECGRMASAERRFLDRIGESCRETAPASLRSKVEGILEKDADGSPDEVPGRSATVTPIGRAWWRRTLVPVAAAALLALLLLRPWRDPVPDAYAGFAADHAAHAVSAPGSHPFAAFADVPAPPPLAARLVGLSECVVDGQTYAHYTYVTGDRHLSVFLPVGGASIPARGASREGSMTVLALEETASTPRAVLVSGDMDEDELRSVWLRV